MKTMLILAILTWGSVAAAIAAETIKIEFVVVQVPLDSGLILLAKLRTPGTDAKTARMIDAVIRGYQANLIAWLYLRARTGERAETQTVDEIGYPVEFNPAHSVDKVDPRGLRWFKATDDLLSILPIARDHRLVGVTLAVEPTLIENRLHLSLSARHVRLLGFARYRPRQLPRGHSDHPSTFDQPRFLTHSVSTELVLQSGEWRLMGTFIPPDLPKTMELMILQAEASSANSKN